MQRLNPGLGLRCAVSTWRPDYTKLSESVAIEIQKNMEMEESGPSEYLVYDRTSLDVVTIVMPEPPTDDSMSGFTDLNREGGTHETDLGDFRYGPRRQIEPLVENCSFARDPTLWSAWRDGVLRRTKTAMKRPRTGWVAFAGCNRAGASFATRTSCGKSISRGSPTIFCNTSTQVITHSGTMPIGTISYIDAYDFPIETHYARARQIVAAGSEFAIVGNTEAAEARVFRMSGVECFTDDFKIPEWSSFEVPVRADWTEQ